MAFISKKERSKLSAKVTASFTPIKLFTFIVIITVAIILALICFVGAVIWYAKTKGGENSIDAADSMLAAIIGIWNKLATDFGDKKDTIFTVVQVITILTGIEFLFCIVSAFLIISLPSPAQTAKTTLHLTQSAHGGKAKDTVKSRIH